MKWFLLSLGEELKDFTCETVYLITIKKQLIRFLFSQAAIKYWSTINRQYLQQCNELLIFANPSNCQPLIMSCYISWNNYLIYLLYQESHLKQMSKILRHQRTISRYTRSKSINHNTSNRKPQAKIDRQNVQHQHTSVEKVQSSTTPTCRKQKHNSQQTCKKCECLKKKLKERQDHFKKIIEIYHSEIDKLKQINDSLRNQLEDMFSKEQALIKEIDEFKSTILEYQNRKIAENKHVQEPTKRKKQLQLCITPIQKGRQPITIQRISQKILLQLQSPTFSQLLAGTPQISNLSDPPNHHQKENALKAEFDRLMNQCEMTSNRSKKTTIRKQMASIANQLANFEKQQHLRS